VSVEELPASLRGVMRSSDELKEMLFNKMFQRLKTDHPLSNLHRIFRSAGQDTRWCSKQGLKAVFQRYGNPTILNNKIPQTLS
jgi:hypothetical protein